MLESCICGCRLHSDIGERLVESLSGKWYPLVYNVKCGTRNDGSLISLKQATQFVLKSTFRMQLCRNTFV